MLSDKAVEAIQGSTHTEEFEINGIKYFSRPLFDVRKEEPTATPLAINTLTGIVDYLKANVDSLEAGSLMIHVASHERVNLLGKLQGHFRQRETVIVAQNEALFSSQFKFGAFYDAESFIIALQTLFVRDDDIDSILRIVGNIKEEDVKTVADDGVTQTVTAKAGIARVAEIEVPNPVTLRPFRTFRDIEQPASLFVLRMRRNQGSLPSCALFEADGGKWKLDAITEIKGFLQDNTESIVIVG